MKVRLLRDARIKHKAGEIVEVSPAELHFLVSTGTAVEVAVNPPVKAETAEKPVAKVTRAKKETKKK
jgi:hypothetical protein